MGRDNKKGFTIIEVVIVLAIAGLIFAVVFWALPNLQKNQRDNTRRTIVGDLMANLQQDASNRNGNYPTTAAEFVSFMTTFYGCAEAEGADLSSATCEFRDPLKDVVWDWNDATSAGSVQYVAATADIGTMEVVRNGQCDATTTGNATGDNGSRAFAVLIALENGVSYCVDNN